MCAALVAKSAPVAGGYFLSEQEEVDGSPIDTTDIKYIGAPATSIEFWAWQFGRVAALASSFDDGAFDQQKFEGWGNGILALSLLLGSGRPVEWKGRWAGAVVTCDDQTLEDAGALKATSHLYWLMHIGMLNAVRRLERQHPRAVTDNVMEQMGSEGSEVLLLGNYAELGEAIKLAEEYAEQKRGEQATTELKEHLPQVWDMLSEDAQAHLIEAELNLKKRRLRDASLDYANSVEAALREFITRPKDVKRWPGSFGEWTARLREMTAANSQQDYGAREFKRWFDVKYAADLADALEVFQTGRQARGHSGERLPSAHKARRVALGIQQQSVFELLLRFAKRWRG